MLKYLDKLEAWLEKSLVFNWINTWLDKKYIIDRSKLLGIIWFSFMAGLLIGIIAYA